MQNVSIKRDFSIQNLQIVHPVSGGWELWCWNKQKRDSPPVKKSTGPSISPDLYIKLLIGPPCMLLFLCTKKRQR